MAYTVKERERKFTSGSGFDSTENDYLIIEIQSHSFSELIEGIDSLQSKNFSFCSRGDFILHSPFSASFSEDFLPFKREGKWFVYLSTLITD